MRSLKPGETLNPEPDHLSGAHIAAGQPWVRVAEKNALDTSPSEGRLHTCVNGRYVSIIRYANNLHCLDSVCFHAGGPLALGEIEEISGTACLVCPWHFYHVSLKDGEKWYQAAQPGEDGKLHAGKWKSVGQRQRLHDVQDREDGLYVRLNLSGDMASDVYACKHECGARVKSGAVRFGIGDRDGSLSPRRSTRSASPLRSDGSISPRGSMLMEGEDVWPEDLVDRRSPHPWRGST